MGASLYRVTLERGRDGTYLAWVDDLPGCAARAASREAVLDRLPAAIRSFLAWAGEDDLPSTIDVEVVEEVESPIAAEEDTEALVRPDRQPLTASEWTPIADLLARSRAELLDVLDALTDDRLPAKREGSERTIGQEIAHVAFVELMYAVWTFDRESKQGLRELLAWARAVTADRMEALAGQDAGGVTWADWGGAPRREPWTARKAARRLLWHELLHLRAIERFVRRNTDAP